MKPKLLLLHGALGSKKQFEGLIPLLDKDFEVYAMNFEGHGGKASSHPFSIELFTHNLLDFLKAQGISSINIFGYSMGGYVALQLALNHPSYVNKVITLGTKFDWSPEASAKEIKMLNPEKIAEKVPRFAEKLSLEHAPLNWVELVNKTALMMKGMGEGAKIELADFRKIKQEVIIGLGEKDSMVSKEETDLVGSQLSNGTTISLKDVPHPIDKIDPKVIAEFIRESV